MQDLDHHPETQQRRIDEHRELLDLARTGKAKQLRTAWIAHLESTETALLEALAAREAASAG